MLLMAGVFIVAAVCCNGIRLIVDEAKLSDAFPSSALILLQYSRFSQLPRHVCFLAIFSAAAVSWSLLSGLMRLLFRSIACYSQRRVSGVVPGLLADRLAVTGPVSTVTTGPRPRGHVCLSVLERFKEQ